MMNDASNIPTNTISYKFSYHIIKAQISPAPISFSPRQSANSSVPMNACVDKSSIQLLKLNGCLS